MAHTDESVEKLESFCSLLARVNDALRADADAVASNQDELAAAHDACEESLDALDHGLEELREGVDQGEASASGAIDGTAESARRASARLEQDETELEAAGSTFDARLDEACAEVDRSGADLATNGHAALIASMDEVGAGLDASGSRSDEAFDSLAAALRESRDALEQAAAECATSVADDALALDDAGFAVGTEAEAARGALDDEEQLADQGLDSAADQIAEAYAGLRELATAVAAALAQEVAAHCAQAAGALVADPEAPFAAATQQALTSIARYEGQRVDDTSALADEGASLMADVHAAAPEIEKALGVIPRIDQLLEAMG
jgi:chromosome segregation ATPase